MIIVLGMWLEYDHIIVHNLFKNDMIFFGILSVLITAVTWLMKCPGQQYSLSLTIFIAAMAQPLLLLLLMQASFRWDALLDSSLGNVFLPALNEMLKLVECPTKGSPILTCLWLVVIVEHMREKVTNDTLWNQRLVSPQPLAPSLHNISLIISCAPCTYRSSFLEHFIAFI